MWHRILLLQVPVRVKVRRLRRVQMRSRLEGIGDQAQASGRSPVDPGCLDDVVEYSCLAVRLSAQPPGAESDHAPRYRRRSVRLVQRCQQLLDKNCDRAADGVRVGEVPHASGSETREQARWISAIASQRGQGR